MSDKRYGKREKYEIARAIESSQPTVTRARNKPEKKGYIREYSAILNFKKLGYQVCVFGVEF